MNAVITLRPAMRYAIFRVLHLIVLGVLFLALAWLFLPAFVLIAVGFMGLAFWRVLQLRFTCFILNEEVLQIKTGILLRRKDNLELYRVKDYVVTESLLMQLLGLMSLELLTTDISSPVTVLRGIPKSDIAEVIRERVQQARQRNPIVELN